MHAQRFRTQHLDHVGLVAATAEAFEFPMYDRDPLPYWSLGRVTLLGDALHPMYPMGSNGAGQTILDAASLSTQLACHVEPAQALLAYQNQRLPVAREVVRRNRTGARRP
jgi:2-polyprenyl-6-methoxyphenol hydroxylase-like FAD-dependent oxidoreductase